MTFTPSLLSKICPGKKLALKPGHSFSNEFGTWTGPEIFTVLDFSGNEVSLCDSEMRGILVNKSRIDDLFLPYFGE